MDIVTLVGPRTTGKSTVGRIMADSLGWEFVQMDAYMKIVLKHEAEQNYKLKIALEKDIEKEEKLIKEKQKTLEMIELEGPIGFMKVYGCPLYMKLLHKNLKNLLSLLKGRKVILDCGGGATSSEFPESKLNAELVRKYSTIVLILPHEDDEEGLKILYERERKRSFFKDWPEEKLRKKVRKDYFERVPGMKECAHHIVHSGRKSPRKIAKMIKKLLKLA